MRRWRLLGQTIGLSAPQQVLGLLEGLLAPLGAFDQPSPADVVYSVTAADGAFTLRRDEVVADRLARADIFARLLSDLVLLLVARRDVALLHAGAVTDGKGALLIGGSSGRGKTSLTAALVKAGRSYLSDELAPLGLQDLHVRPVPLPLKLRQSALPRLPDLPPEITLHRHPFAARGEQVFFGIPSQGALAGDGSWPVAAVVFPYFGQGDTALYELPPPVGVSGLMQLTLNAAALPDAGFDAAARLADRVPCYELALGDLPRAAALLDALLS